MQEPSYWCKECSTRATVIMVPEAERAAHERMHASDTLGALCPKAGAIVPMHSPFCDWCGQVHEATYEWDGVSWNEL